MVPGVSQGQVMELLYAYLIIAGIIGLQMLFPIIVRPYEASKIIATFVCVILWPLVMVKMIADQLDDEYKPKDSQ